jgi:hypothetical protein
MEICPISDKLDPPLFYNINASAYLTDEDGEMKKTISGILMKTVDWISIEDKESTGLLIM